MTLTADDYAVANQLFVLDSCKSPVAIATLVLLVAVIRSRVAPMSGRLANHR